MPTNKQKQQEQTELQKQQTEEIEREEVGDEYYDEFTHEGDDLTPKAGQEIATHVENIPFEPEPQTNDKAIMVVEENRTMLAEGVYITPGMPFLDVMRMQTMVTSYTG